MGRFLFVAYPETGHVFPLVSAAVALQQRGHQVAFYSGRSFGQTISSANLTFCEPREWKSPKEENSFPTELLSDSANSTGGEAQAVVGRIMRYRLLGSIEAMVSDIEWYVRQLDIHVIVQELLSPGAGLAAERLGLPWVSVATHPLPVIEGYKTWMPSSLWCWFEDDEIFQRLQLPARPGNLLGRISPYLHLIPATLNFVGKAYQLPAQAHCVGPLSWSPPLAQVPDWFHQICDSPTPILVSCSSINPSVFERTQADLERYVRSAIEGLAGEPVTVIITLTDGLCPEAFTPLPANVRVEQFFPHQHLMPWLKAVITHGGWGLVGRALSQGLPLVIVPFGADQSVNAELCQKMGLGMTIPLNDISPASLRAAVRRVLDEPTYHIRARAESETIHSLKPPEAAADLLETL